MLTKYRIDKLSFSPKIENIEISRETLSCVFVKTSVGERKEAKVSTFTSYHDTWYSAHAELLRWAREQETAAKRHLDRTTDCLNEVENMRETT